MNASRPNPTPIPESALVREPGGIPVPSSLLARVAYDADRAILQLELHSGAVYQYFHVPLQTYRDLLQADSRGAYFNHHIRGFYPFAALHRA